MSPSTQQAESDESFEPSEYADEFSVDPARLLAKNEEMVLARIRGTVDPDLLDAYLQIEVDRHSRSDVIGAINKRKQELRECPRGCDSPIVDRLVSTSAVQIEHAVASHHRTCIVPRDIDGQCGLELVYHDTTEPQTAPSPEPETASDAESESDASDTEQESDDDDRDEPVGQRPKKLYHKMRTTDGTMNKPGIVGWAGTQLGLSPDETEHVLQTLVNGGHVDEVDEGVYAVEDGDHS